MQRGGRWLCFEIEKQRRKRENGKRVSEGRTLEVLPPTATKSVREENKGGIPPGNFRGRKKEKRKKKRKREFGHISIQGRSFECAFCLESLLKWFS